MRRGGSMFSQWLLWACLAVVCWGLWAITSKLIGEALTAGQSQAVSTLGILPVLATLWRAGRGSVNARNKSERGWLAGLAAGVVVCAGNVAYYHALKIGGKAATVVSITALYPLVTVLLAIVLLAEKLNGIQVFGIGLSLISITVFNISTVEGFMTGWLAYALAPVVLWGVGGLLQKISTNYISGEASTFWFLVAFVPVAAVLLAWEPLPRFAGKTWALAAALGFLFSLGNLAILFAFARGGKASIIAPLAGLYPVVSIPVAILFLGERVTSREWTGIGLALAAVVALACESRETVSEVEMV